MLLLLLILVVWAMWKTSKAVVVVGLIWFFVLGAPGCNRHREYQAEVAASAADVAPLPLSHEVPQLMLTNGPLAHERGW